MRELGIGNRLLDQSSGNNSTQMVENKPGSFILKGQNPRSFNSINYAPGLSSNGDNKSGSENHNDLFVPPIEHVFYETNNDMLNQRRSTMNLELNSSNHHKMNHKVVGNNNKSFGPRYENTLKNTKTRKKIGHFQGLFRNNESTLDSDK